MKISSSPPLRVCVVFVLKFHEPGNGVFSGRRFVLGVRRSVRRSLFAVAVRSISSKRKRRSVSLVVGRHTLPSPLKPVCLAKMFPPVRIWPRATSETKSYSAAANIHRRVTRLYRSYGMRTLFEAIVGVFFSGILRRKHTNVFHNL